ncbi:rab-GTPase-TBC domain-containing protein [Lipomyces kononenkoae]
MSSDYYYNPHSSHPQVRPASPARPSSTSMPSTSGSGTLLFAKSKVYVHPTSSAKDNIPGFIALVRPPGGADKDILVAWVPESQLRSDEISAYMRVDLTMDDGLATREVLVPMSTLTSIASYAFAVPLHRLYSIMLRPPSLGWWWGSVIIHTRSEDVIPALFFHDAESQSTIMQQKLRNKTPFAQDGDLFWGGDQFMKYLRRYTIIERSTFEQRLYLINPDPDDLLSFSPPNARVEKANNDTLSKIIKDARWNVLERLARVTRFSRRAAHEVIGNSPPAVRAMLNVPEVRQLGDDFDSARVYLAKWAMSISEEAERNKTKIVWTDVVGDHIGPMAGDILSVDDSIERRNEVSRDEWKAFFDASGRLRVTVSEVKERVFHGGLSRDIRSEAWLFLLDVFPWDSSQIERQSIMAAKRDEYFRLKRQWWDDINRQQVDPVWKDQRNRIEKDVHRTDRNILLFAGEDTPHPDPDSPFANIGTNVHLEQLKDMLITYNEYNKSLGYVQGMSDLLSPIYAVVQDDALAFWAFVGFMNRMQRNFLRDQSGMHRQLLALDNLVQLMEPQLYTHLEKADSTNFFFMFRMLLVWFKREFKWDDVLRLWEVLWTDYLSSQFVIFVGLAILDKHKDVIMEHLEHFDEVLKYMNELSKTMDLEETLTRAEVLFYRFQRTVEAIDRKNKEPSNSSSFPSTPLTPHQSMNGYIGIGLPEKTLPLKPEAGKVIISDVLRELLSKEVIVVNDTIPMEGYET